MIHRFSCENFYSIGKEIVVDFTVSKSAPSKSTYAENANNTRVSLVETVIGPNASGKTTILKTLAFLQWLIVDAYTDDPDKALPVRPFGHKETTKPTVISVDFSVGDRLFIYDFKLNRNRVLFEELSEKSKTSERVTTKVLFTREWNNADDKYDFSDRVFGITQEKLRKNSSVVATAFRDKNPIATLIAQYWRDCVSTNVYEQGYRHYHQSIRDHLAGHAVEFFYSHPDLKERVELLLSKYDIGFGAFTKHEVQEDKPVYRIEHRFGSNTFELPLEYESSGTKQTIVILRYVLKALSEGGIAVIDELDANLHPEIVEELISMFTSKDLNPLSAQIIFSSHTPTILATLDKYQITFVEKNEEGQSEVWRLDSVKGVRPDDNYYAKYIAGAYGAVPNIG